MTDSGESDYGPVMRAVGNFRVEIQRDRQPPGWAFVRLMGIAGDQRFAGILEVGEIPIELVVQLERARAYDLALTNLDRSDSDD